MFTKFCKSVSALMLVAVVAVATATTPLQASLTFTLGYTVNSNSGSGLIIETSDIASQGFSFDLTGVGDSESFDLFRIWTPEEALNLGEDTTAQPISVDFAFTTPPPPFGGAGTGSTVAGTIFLGSWGQVDWNNPTILNFGAANDGQLEITLSDESFNGGLGLGFTPGEAHGANVSAKFKLLAEPSDPVGNVPEPTTVLVWSGLALLGAVAGRRFYR